MSNSRIGWKSWYLYCRGVEASNEWVKCKWRQNINCISRRRCFNFFPPFHITPFSIHPQSHPYSYTYKHFEKKKFSLNPSPFVPWGKLNYLIYRIAAPLSLRTKFLFSLRSPSTPSPHSFPFFCDAYCYWIRTVICRAVLSSFF